MSESDKEQLPQPRNDFAFSLTVFAHPEQWILARGYPPPLRDTRAWVRGMRGTAIVGLLGCLTGVQIVVGILVVGESNVGDSWSAGAMIGCLFGLTVLVPISRWSGAGFSSLTFVACSALTHLPFFNFISSNNAADLWFLRFWMCFAMATTVQLIRPVQRHVERRVDRVVFLVLPLMCTILGLCIVKDDLDIYRHMDLLNPGGDFSEFYDIWRIFAAVVPMEFVFALGFSGPFWVNSPVEVSNSCPSPDLGAPQT